MSPGNGEQRDARAEGSCAWRFHDLVVAGRWADAALGERWRRTFASRPTALAGEAPDLTLSLAPVGAVPPAPSGAPDFRQGDLLAYYLNGHDVVAHFPRFGQLRLDLAAGQTEGALTAAALATHGVFEDVLAIGLSPHLRRRGQFLLHAFAACPPGPGPAALIVGDIGAGKTTTGLALLHAGWRLLSNDSPILRARSGAGPVEVLSYPGLLSAYPDTLARFAELTSVNITPNLHQKVLFAADDVYPQPWAEAACAGAILFPQIESRADPALERLPAPEALRQILPHAIEQWDQTMIPAHLALLNQLVQSAPAYRLRLAPDLDKLPDLLRTVVE